MSVAARALETPKSCSRSRRVRRSRSSASSWRMASGMARSHRGVAGIGERRVGYNPCGACEVGRCLACMLCSMLVDGRPRCKLRAGRGRGSHKGSYGTVRKGDGSSAGTGGRGAQNGRPEPVCRANQDRATAVTPPPAYPRCRRILTGPGRARAVNKHGRTNLGPLAARPHLSPVPDRLPGRPTSDHGGPGLRRLYGYFRGGVLPEREQPVCRFTEEIRRVGAIFHPCFLNLSPGQPFLVCKNTKMNRPPACTYLSGCTT